MVGTRAHVHHQVPIGFEHKGGEWVVTDAASVAKLGRQIVDHNFACSFGVLRIEPKYAFDLANIDPSVGADGHSVWTVETREHDLDLGSFVQTPHASGTRSSCACIDDPHAVVVVGVFDQRTRSKPTTRLGNSRHLFVGDQSRATARDLEMKCRQSIAELSNINLVVASCFQSRLVFNNRSTRLGIFR